jgi:hypothetical protein
MRRVGLHTATSRLGLGNSAPLLELEREKENLAEELKAMASAENIVDPATSPLGSPWAILLRDDDMLITPHVFGVPGEENIHLVEALSRSSIRYVLVRHEQAASFMAEVTGPVWLSASEQRVAGVTYRRADGATGVVRAPLVIAADGGSSRLGILLGLHRNPRRPMSVAVRAYYRSPRSATGVMEGFLEMRTKRAGANGSDAGELLPGYGWIFPLDDGLVNVGWGLLSSSRHFRTTNYRRVLQDWVAGFPPEWGIGADTLVGTPRSAGLPRGHNRTPPAHRRYRSTPCRTTCIDRGASVSSRTGHPQRVQQT